MKKLKVLVCHNRYQQRGGEDSVFESEVALLRDRGHSVQLFEKDNHDIGNDGVIRAAIRTVWSADSAREFDNQLSDFKPHVVHVHNTFARISPSIYWSANKAGVPVVQTLHNFRLICPQALLLRDGSICEDCVGKLPWRSVVHRCFRSSASQTAVLASMVTIHRALGTWNNRIQRYIALNEFCRGKFIEGGLPSERIRVKPNFVQSFDFPETERKDFLFVGRFSEEKGIRVVSEALSISPHIRMSFAGQGEEASLVENLENATMLGPLPANDVHRKMGAAIALVLPSIWYENFPRTIVEAFSCGLPVIASNIGALSVIVENGRTGLLFEPGNSKDLASKLEWARSNPEKMAAMGVTAKLTFDEKYSADPNYSTLMEIYREAIDEFAKAQSS